MKRKILLIGDVVGSYRSQNLVKSLLDRGYVVELTTGSFYFFAHRGNSLPFCIIKRAINLFVFFLYIVDVFIKSIFADVLYLLPMNGRYAILAYFAKLFSRKPLLVELYISVYDSGRDRSRFKSDDSLRAKYYRLLDRIMIEKSDVLIHISKTELEYIADLVGAQISSTKTRILPLAVDPKGTAAPIPSQTFRVCWWGTFIPLHGLDKIIATAKILVDSGVDIRFDLFGLPSPEAHVYEQMIVDFEVKSQVMMHTDKSFVNGKLEPFLQTHCDLALGNFGESEKARMVIVNKIIDAFAMKLPVLTMSSPALSEFIDEDNDLFVCGNRPEEIATAIKMIKNFPEQRSQRASAGYACYQRTFTIQSYIYGVQETLETILGTSQ